jgi:hypothetical protein
MKAKKGPQLSGASGAKLRGEKTEGLRECLFIICRSISCVFAADKPPNAKWLHPKSAHHSHAKALTANCKTVVG